MSELPDFLEELDPTIFLSDNYVVLDLETTNLDYGDACNPDNSLLLACWNVVRDGRVTKKSKWGSEYEQQELIKDIEESDFFVAHNAIFETKWLERCGLDTKDHLSFCTQVGEYVLSGNRMWTVALQSCATRRGWEGKEDLVSFYLKKGICVSELPKSWVESYCVQDVDLCNDLFLSQRKTILINGLLPVAFCRNLRTPILADIEKIGMTLDPERVEEEYNKLCNDIVELESEFNDLTGGVNVKSAPQMRELLYDTLKFKHPKDYKGNTIVTPKGEVATNATALMSLKATTKKQKEFLELRNQLVKAKDAKSKYMSSMWECCQENKGHLQGAYNPTRTQTHRLSSSGRKYRMQLQNLPRVYKRLFKARYEGWLVAENDYPQLEFRTAVDMARDEQGLEDIRNDEDIHAFSASVLFGPEFTEADPEGGQYKELRTKAKAHSFKPLYGGQSGTPDQVRYYKAFRKKYKGITEWQEQSKSVVLKSGQLVIPSGLILYWPTTKVTRTGYITNTTQICNYPVQSFATADIVPLGMVYQWHRLKRSGLKSFLISTVHDSTIGEVHPDEVAEYDKIAKQALEVDVFKAIKKLYNYEWITPIEVEGEYYRNWADKSSGVK